MRGEQPTKMTVTIIKKIGMLIKENKGKKGLQQMVKEIAKIRKKKDKEDSQDQEIQRDKVFIKIY